MSKAIWLSVRAKSIVSTLVERNTRFLTVLGSPDGKKLTGDAAQSIRVPLGYSSERTKMRSWMSFSPGLASINLGMPESSGVWFATEAACLDYLDWLRLPSLSSRRRMVLG